MVKKWLQWKTGLKQKNKSSCTKQPNCKMVCKLDQGEVQCAVKISIYKPVKIAYMAMGKPICLRTFFKFPWAKFQDFLNSLSKKLQNAKQQIMHPIQYYIWYKMWQVNWHGKRLNVHYQISGILCHKEAIEIICATFNGRLSLFPKKNDYYFTTV